MILFLSLDTRAIALDKVKTGCNLEPSLLSLPSLLTNIIPSTEVPTLNSNESNVVPSAAKLIVSSPAAVAV